MAAPVRFMGVPEHFNTPFTRCPTPLYTFTQCPGGTGAMITALVAGHTDCAVALTEGILTAVIASNDPSGTEGESATPLKYVGEYVTSPLRWAIVRGNGGEKHSWASLSELAHRKPINIAVSRLGSGSHLMAFLLAQREGWPAENLVFTIQKDFRSMRRAVCGGVADIFMWEYFMTKPFMDSGELDCVGTLLTPWNCFGFVCRQDWLDVPFHRQSLNDAVAHVLAQAREFLLDEDGSCEQISALHGLSLEDAHTWIRTVRYATGAPTALTASRHMLEEAVQALQGLGIVPTSACIDMEALVDTRVMSWAAEELQANAAGGPHTSPPASPSRSGTTTQHPTAAVTLRQPHATDIFTAPASVISSGAQLGAAHAKYRSRADTGGLDSATARSRSSSRSASETGIAEGTSRTLQSVPDRGATSGGEDVKSKGLWQVKVSESLPPHGSAKDAASRRASKAAALESIMRHLGTFGGGCIADASTPAPTVAGHDAAHAVSSAVTLAKSTESGIYARIPSSRTLLAPQSHSSFAHTSEARVDGVSIVASAAPLTSRFGLVAPPLVRAASASTGASGGGSGKPAYHPHPPASAAPGSRWEGTLYDIG